MLQSDMVLKIYRDLSTLENLRTLFYQLFSTFAQHFTCSLQSAGYISISRSCKPTLPGFDTSSEVLRPKTWTGFQTSSSLTGVFSFRTTSRKSRLKFQPIRVRCVGTVFDL